MLQIQLGHLFSDKLNLYGDKGNILSLKYRLEARGFQVVITEINELEDLDFTSFDFFFMGGGQDQEQVEVAQALKAHKSALEDFIEQGKPFLAICGAYQLLGESYMTSEQEIIEGLAILNVETRAKLEKNEKDFQDRLVGNVVANLNFSLESGSNLQTLVGFENHSGRTFITNTRTQALARVVKGFGNNALDQTEGARYKNLFASYLHGSLLPKNPHLADELIYLMLKAKGLDCSNLKILDDNIEIQAHKQALELK